MSEEKSDGFGAFVAGLVVGASIIFLMTLSFTVPKPWHSKFKQEAVDRGFAEWHLIHAHSGETEFRWLDKPKDSKPASK